MERELIAKVEGRGVDNDAGTVLVYRASSACGLLSELFTRLP